MRYFISEQETKKQLKQRFWTEVYQGAKLFDLTGVINNKYPKTEIKRITLFISRMKFRPLVWRNTHPYVLVTTFGLSAQIGESLQFRSSCSRWIAWKT